MAQCGDCEFYSSGYCYHPMKGYSTSYGQSSCNYYNSNYGRSSCGSCVHFQKNREWCDKSGGTQHYYTSSCSDYRKGF